VLKNICQHGQALSPDDWMRLSCRRGRRTMQGASRELIRLLLLQPRIKKDTSPGAIHHSTLYILVDFDDGVVWTAPDADDFPCIGACVCIKLTTDDHDARRHLAGFEGTIFRLEGFQGVILYNDEVQMSSMDGAQLAQL